MPTRLVNPDTVVTVASPPVNLAVPPDGRINGYGVTTTVTGVATGTQLGPDKPAHGQQLWTFGLNYQIDHSDSLRPAPTPAVTLVEQTTRIPLSRLSGTTGTSYYVTSLPVNAPDVILELASAGYAQDFSLTNMAREGPQPAVLYRNTTGWQTTQPLSAQATMPVPAANGVDLGYDITLSSLSLTFSATSAHLSWFGPDSPSDQPTNLDNGWLTLSVRQSDADTTNWCPSNCNEVDLAPTLTAAQITLTLPGIPPEPSTLLGAGSGPSGTIFNGIYAWQVPAATTAGSVTIAPGTLAVAQQNTSGTVPVPVPGAVSLPFTLPAPTPPNTPLGASTKPARYPQTSTGKPTNKPDGNGTVFPTSSGGGSDTGAIAGAIGGAVAALAAIIIAVVLSRRRRQPMPATTSATQTPATNAHWPATTQESPPPTPPSPPRTSDPATAATPDPDPIDTPGPPQAATVLDHPSAAEPVKTAPAPASPPAPSGPLRVSVLGPVQIEGWAQRPSRRAVIEIVTYLACHPDRPVTTDRLRAAVASGTDSDIDENSLRSYLSHTRRALGAERLPDASIKAGYQLEDVDCDWTHFQQLTAEAEKTPDQAASLLAEALDLVRGDPFADGCTWAETELLPETISNTIAKAATTLATLTVEKDPEKAAHAAGIGLAAHPTDEQLSILALRAAARLGRLQATWEQINTRWADLPLPTDVAAWHDRLTAGHPDPDPS